MSYEPKVGDRVRSGALIAAGHILALDGGEAWIKWDHAGRTSVAMRSLTPAGDGFDWHASQQAEIERLARLMCAAEYGEDLVNSMVNKYQMLVCGPGGNRFVLPRPEDQMPLWRTFERAAAAVIKDRAK